MDTPPSDGTDGAPFSVISGLISQFIAAIAFYTCIPIPADWQLDFQNVARFAPLVGGGIGGLLALLDWGLLALGIPLLTRSAVIVVAWVGITGGLHLDGAMDTADGLAVPDPERRFSVMTDSAAGAFAVMAAIAILLLKTVAVTDLSTDRWLALVWAAGWGRVGQQVAIVRYPYLKATGKGAFHKMALRSMSGILPSLLFLGGVGAIAILLGRLAWQEGLITISMAGAIVLLVPAWFNHKLGGQTGDTYGAIVEWTETLFLIVFGAIARAN